MKAAFILVLVLIVGIAFYVLQGRVSRIGSTGVEITGVDWRPVNVGGVDMPEDSGMQIRFELDGSINGNGGCNRFFGSLQQSDTGVEVGPLGSTRMACPEAIMNRETAFLEAVQAMRAFATDSDGMSLLDEGGAVLARFRASTED